MRTVGALYVSSVKDYSIEFYNVLIDYAPRLVSSLVVLVLGLYAIRFITRLAKKIMARKEMEVTLAEFLSSCLLWGLRALLFVTFISRLGIETTSFVAILGAAGLAIGMSLQGSLANLAGGVLIILFKPFRVGDVIEAQGVSGMVTEIQIFVTKLISGNNQTIMIPNGILSNGIITNFSIAGKRRADLVFSLSYETNSKQPKKPFYRLCKTIQKCLKIQRQK
ncbi:small conductance mechanosensitive channel [Flavobacterium fontis]|uniref:Small conductance mechanosensitive channel n=1 Tax=Flavobacterium fontis TaxID=1124188 RepID=A0A1M5BQN2_9FLAO|nr:small conductance mechanosensitive channel [Flavobacterium fontis]